MSVSAMKPGMTTPPTKGVKADVILPHVHSEQILLASDFKLGQVLLPKEFW